MVTRITGPLHPEDDPNAWLDAVIESCVPTLEQLPDHLRVGAASALYEQSLRGPDGVIPWATIFADDEPQWVSDQLLSAALAPEGQTAAQNPEIRSVVRAMDGQLRAGHIERGGATAAAAGRLIQLAAGKPETPFVIYRDTARELPMKHSWSDMLVRQFGESACGVILAANPHLKAIVRNTEAITGMYYSPAELDYQNPPDSTSTLVHGFLPADERYAAYTADARDIRGLPPIAI